MNKEIINELLNQFIIFSLERREDLFKILIILLFLLFLIRRSRGAGAFRIRKKEIDQALNTLSKKIKYKGEYHIPKEIENKLYQNNFDKSSIIILVANIMKHLGKPNSMPGIILHNTAGNREEKPGYCTSYPDGYSNITINILPEYDLNVIAAIIIHECMHHYLNIKRIKFTDRIENEILTDTCAVYCGFGEYMYHGYKTRAKQYKNEYKLQKVGYLTQNEIRYAMRKCG